MQINYKGHNIELEQLPNGKWKIPDIAKESEGLFGGAQVKPAVEVILVVQKPMDKKTYVEQYLDNGKGVLNLDSCRIPYKDDDTPTAGNRTATFGTQETISGGDGSGGFTANNTGRFPANLLISDDVLDDGKVSGGGKYKGPNARRREGHSLVESYGMSNAPDSYGDSGGYSRFFSLDAWAEKNLPFFICPKASKREKNEGLDGLESKDMEWSNRIKNGDGKFMGTETYSKGDPKMKNNHPTVKPIKLMSYLITMGSRPGDTILDPFMGSGTTGVAAIKLERKFVGVEMDEHYFEIAKSRIKYHEDKNKGKQERLF